jgi:hypothetical protein
MNARPRGKFSRRAAVGLAALAGGTPVLHPAPGAPAVSPAASPPVYDPFNPQAGPPPSKPPAPTPPPTPTPPPAPSAQRVVPHLAPPLWADGAQVRIAIALKTFPNGAGKNAYYRPYVAIWAEDAQRTLVRTIVVLGRDSSYHRHLTSWWRAASRYSESTYMAMTRATRPAGEHQFVWDGYNDTGQPLPKGTYTLFVEICRENGRHTLQSVPLEIGDAPLAVLLPADVESNPGKVEYGPPPVAPTPPATAPAKP